ncbi:uncharacterized protein [Amphiura filiformis]|uniref:uncharacterized protein n=1 Tax=Amphiura filiformis TaxID=82378 RepID=UPI003B215A26
MDESDERDKLQQDIQQIHELLSADEASDDDEEILQETYESETELQIVEASTPAENDQEAEDEEAEPPPIRTLLIRNRQYQELLETLLNQVQQALQNNQSEQKEVENVMLDGASYDGTTSTNKKPVKAMISFFKPYFRDDSGSTPPSNVETQERKSIVHQDPFVTSRTAWSTEELKSLREGVHNDRLRRIQQPMWNRRELLQDKLANPELDDEDKEKIKEELQQLIEDIARANSSNGAGSSCSKSFIKEIDWMRISSMDLDGERTPNECKQQWEVLEKTELNKGKWTSKEETKLVMLADKYKERDWLKIASELGSGRSAFQCIQHYRMNLCTNLTKSIFTPEEDKKMMKLVEKFSHGNYIPYTKVAYFMDGHSHKQVCMRWTNTLSPDIKSGKWSADENELLRQVVKKYGTKSWSKIADLIPGRTAMQVRDRWCGHVAPNVKRGQWDPQEDLKMINLIIKHGLGNWRKVADDMFKDEESSRTCNSLLIRFRNMVTKLRKKNKISNGKDIPTDTLLQILKEQKQRECDIIEENKTKPIKISTRKSPHTAKDEVGKKRRTVTRDRAAKRDALDKLERLDEVDEVDEVKQGDRAPQKPYSRGRKYKTVEESSLEENIIELLKPTTHKGIRRKTRTMKKPKQKAKQSMNNKAAYAMLLKVYDVKVKEESRMVENMLGVKSYTRKTSQTSSHAPVASPSQSREGTPLRTLDNHANSQITEPASAGTSHETPARDLLQEMINQEQLPPVTVTMELVHNEASGSSGNQLGDEIATSTDTLQETCTFTSLRTPVNTSTPASSTMSSHTQPDPAVTSLDTSATKILQGIINQDQAPSDIVNVELVVDYEEEVGNDQQSDEVVAPVSSSLQTITCPSLRTIADTPTPGPVPSPDPTPVGTSDVTPVGALDVTPNLPSPPSGVEVDESGEADVEMQSVGDDFDDAGMASDSDYEESSQPVIPDASTIETPTQETVRLEEQETIKPIDSQISATPTKPTEAITPSLPPEVPTTEAMSVSVALPSPQVISTTQTQVAMPSIAPVVPTTTPVIQSTTPVIQSITPVIQSTTPVIQGTTPVIPSSIPVIPATTSIIPALSPVVSTSASVVPVVPIASTCPVPPSTPVISSSQNISTVMSTPLPQATVINTPVPLLHTPVPVALCLANRQGTTPQQHHLQQQVLQQTPQRQVSTAQVVPSPVVTATPVQPHPTGLPATPSTPSTPLLTQLASVIQQGGQLQPISSPVGAIQSNVMGNMQQAGAMQQNMIVVGSAPVVPIFIPGLGNVYGFMPGSMQLAPAGLTNNQWNTNVMLGGVPQVIRPPLPYVQQPGLQPMMGGAGLMQPGVGNMQQVVGMTPGMMSGMMPGVMPGVGNMGITPNSQPFEISTQAANVTLQATPTSAPALSTGILTTPVVTQVSSGPPAGQTAVQYQSNPAAVTQVVSSVPDPSTSVQDSTLRQGDSVQETTVATQASATGPEAHSSTIQNPTHTVSNSEPSESSEHVSVVQETLDTSMESGIEPIEESESSIIQEEPDDLRELNATLAQPESPVGNVQQNVVTQRHDGSSSQGESSSKKFQRDVQVIYADGSSKIKVETDIPSRKTKRKRRKKTVPDVLVRIYEDGGGLSSILPSLNSDRISGYLPKLEDRGNSVNSNRAVSKVNPTTRNLASLPQQISTTTSQMSVTPVKLDPSAQRNEMNIGGLTPTGDQPVTLPPSSSNNVPQSPNWQTTSGDANPSMAKTMSSTIAETISSNIQSTPSTSFPPTSITLSSNMPQTSGISLHPIPDVRPVASILPPSTLQSFGTQKVIITKASMQSVGRPQSSMTTIPVSIMRAQPIEVLQQKARILKPGSTNGKPPPPRPNLPVRSLIGQSSSDTSAMTGTPGRHQVKMLRPVAGVQKTIGGTPVRRFAGKRMPSQMQSADDDDEIATTTNIQNSDPSTPLRLQRLSDVLPHSGNPEVIQYHLDPRTGIMIRSDAPCESSKVPSHMPFRPGDNEISAPTNNQSSGGSHPPPVQRLSIPKTQARKAVPKRQLTESERTKLAQLNQMAEQVLGSDATDEKSIPFLPPNSATLMALKTLLLHRRMLEQNASVYRSAGQTQEKVKRYWYKGYMASKSQDESGNSSQPETSEDTAAASEPHPLAHVLPTSDFKRLQERFMSVFAWPALLSTVTPRSKTKGKISKPQAQAASTNSSSEQQSVRKRAAEQVLESATTSEEPCAKISKPSEPNL